jgi:hypothetical protein
MRNVPLKLAASLLVFVAAADPAVAAVDGKNYSGLACLASGSAGTSISYNYSTGRAENPTTVDIAFICPAVKDHIDYPINRAAVYVLDQRPDRSVSCTLRSGYLGGTAQWFSTNATTASFYGSTPAELTFGGLPTDNLGHYWFSCTVPGLNTSNLPSGIVMYSLVENT